MILSLATALLTASLIVPVEDRLPTFDVKSICEADVKASGAAQGRAVESCIEDENSARTTIESQWPQFSPPVRSRCVAETQVGGNPSYVDVLECMRLGSNKPPT